MAPRFVVGPHLLVLLTLVAALGAHASTNDTTGTRRTIRLDADPINMALGEYTFLETLSQLRGPFPLGFRFYYGSARNTRRLPDGLPFKFAHNLHGTLVHATAAGTIALEPGLADEIAFAKQGADWVVADNEPSRLRMLESGDFYYLVDPNAETASIYRRAATNGTEVVATLRAVLDRNGNRWIYSQPDDPATHGPTLVTDTLGRSYTLEYNTVGTVDTAPYLTRVTDHGGRRWRFLYEENPPDAPNRVTLRHLVDPADGTNRFAYATNGFHFLHSLTLPRGNAPSRQTYRGTRPEDAFRGVVVSQLDARTNLWLLDAPLLEPQENPLSRLVLSQPDGTRRGFLHDHFGRVARRFVDEEGRVIDYEVDPARDVFTAVVDRRGRTNRIVVHESGRLGALVNARGFRTEFTYGTRTQVLVNPFNLETFPAHFVDLLRVDYPDGAFEEFSHDAHGNVLSARDRVGAITRFGYDARGQVIARTNALGGVTTFTYDDAGNLASLSDSDGVSRAFGYDALFRRTSITNADGTVVRFEYDSLDRMRGIVDELGIRLEMAYDANGNLTNLVRAAGTVLAQTTRLSWDELDRLIGQVDPAGFGTSFSHTYRGAIDTTTFADGTSLRRGYDRRQMLVELRDEAGHLLRIQRDGEGLPTFLLTPAGRRFHATFDPVGFPVELIDGRTNRFVTAYDAMQRPTNLVDRLGRGVSLHRDAEGRLQSLRLPVVGALHYLRNGLGQITRLTDFRGSPWEFSYSPMGRLRSVRDPLNQVWSLAYDNRGRTTSVTHPDGIVESLAYDPRGSLVGRTFSDGLALSYEHDALRRLTRTGSAPVDVTYDARDLPVAQTQHGTTFTAAYDARGRLQSLDYAGVSAITYAYDVRGLPLRIQDGRTGAFVELEYDADRLLRRIRRSNGVTTDFEHDANGQVVRIHHVGRADLNLVRNPGDEITGRSATGLLDIAALLPDESLSFAYDAAHQLTPAGFSHDLRGRRTRDPQRRYGWDAADRLVAITNGPTIIHQEFTARGDIATSQSDGGVTQFFHHDAIGGRPVLAERRAGAFRRYYVFTPSGTLLFAVALPDDRPSFHHFDPAGTTVLLTGPDGNVTDSYGYTPFGRLVRHEGSSDQPYTFQGALGVREIRGTGLFHMGARFFDSLTGRFLSRDPSWLALLESPGNLNPYGFARQNPLGFADPRGREAKPIGPGDASQLSNPGDTSADFDRVAAEARNGLDELRRTRERFEDTRRELGGLAPRSDDDEFFFDPDPPFVCPGSDAPRSDPGAGARALVEVVNSQVATPRQRPLDQFVPHQIPVVEVLLSSTVTPPLPRAPFAPRSPKTKPSDDVRALQLTHVDRTFFGSDRLGMAGVSALSDCRGGSNSILVGEGTVRRLLGGRWLPLLALGGLWWAARAAARRRPPRL